MITVEVYKEGYMELGGPVATIVYSGRGNNVNVTSEEKDVKAELEVFTKTTLALQNQGIVSPTDRQEWVEALPIAITSVPYWFKLASDPNELQEEETNDIEEIADDTEEEDGEEGIPSDNEGDEGLTVNG